jgi:hypothetical protein
MTRWFPGLATVLVCAIAAGCAGPTAPTEQGGGAILTEPQPEAMRTDGYLDFIDLSLRPVASGLRPDGPHVQGWILGGLFTPVSDVRGGLADEPPPGRIASRGFLELRTRAFVRPDSQSPPVPPYVEGFQDTETGGFYPSSSVRYAPGAPGGDPAADEEAVSEIRR